MKIVIFIIIVFSAFARAEKTSRNDEQFKQWLKKFPAADTDKNGTLTESEVKAFQKSRVNNGNIPTPQQNQNRVNLMPAATLTNVQYGSHERNVFDFWKAESSNPIPVLVFFHGGGFVAGDKSKYYGDPLVLRCLSNGISVVTANYRFVTTHPFPAPHHDGGRVIQYLRWKAKEWGIDTKRIACTGGSAGANISVWLAVHDDLADRKSADPVSRESTRISFAIGNGVQTSNDPRFIWKNIVSGQPVHPSMYPFFGLKGDADMAKSLESKMLDTVARESSAINHVTKDDPPLLLKFGKSELGSLPLPAGTAANIYIHHPAFGKFMQEEYKKINLECHWWYMDKPGTTDEEWDFVLKHFGRK